MLGTLGHVKTTLHIAAFVACFGLTACDDGPADDLGADRSAELEADADEALPSADAGDAADAADARPHGRDGKFSDRGGKKLSRLCDALECTDAQVAQLTEVMAKGKGEGPRHGPDDARKAANEALATAFRGDGFSQADLDAYGKAVTPHDNPRRDRLVTMATSVHAILTPEQRGKLADEVVAGKLGMLGFGGRHGGHEGKRGGDRQGKPEGEHQARRAGKLCEALACTDAQRTEVEAAFAKLPAPSKPDQAAIETFAAAFRGDGLSSADVEAFAAAMGAGHEAKQEAIGALALQLHGILDADQRGTIADRIEHRGLHALAGKGGRHGKRRGRRGKRPGNDAPSNEGLGLG